MPNGETRFRDDGTGAPAPAPTRRPAAARFLAGARDCLPIVLGYLAIGLAFGVVAHTAGLSVAEVAAMSLILYAGSAQFITVGFIAAGAPAMPVVLTIFLVNIRHLLYSAAMAPRLGRLPVWKNLLLGAELTDESFALATGPLSKGSSVDPAWLFGINVTAQASWLAFTALGALLGQAVSNVQTLGLDFALTAMFAALLVLQIAHRPRLRIAILVTLAGALIAVVCSLFVSPSWAVLVAAVAAATLGIVLEDRKGP